MGQPHRVYKLEKRFGDVKNFPVYKTPGTPNRGMYVQRWGSGLDENKQKTYCSAVGTLLQFTKHSRPDIVYPVRELSKWPLVLKRRSGILNLFKIQQVMVY